MNLDLRYYFPATGLFLSLALAGCQTSDFGELIKKAGEAGSTTETASAPSGDETGKRVSWDFYTPFYDQVDHLKELLNKDRNFEDAATLYMEQKEFFAVSTAKYRIILDELTKRLNEPKLASLQKALTGLDGIKWPSPRKGWSGIKDIIRSSEATMESYPSHAILNEPDFRAPEADKLKIALADLKTGIETDAPSEFKAFDHFGEESFFDVYPVDIYKFSFMPPNFSALEPKLSAASTHEIKSFAKNYPKNVMGEENWDKVGGLYVAASLKEAGPESAADLASVLAAINGAKEAGFAPKKVPGLKIAFVEVTSKTLLKQGQIDFEASVDVDLPVETVKADLDDALTNPTAEGADFLIVFDVALAKASRHVLNLKKVSSTLLAGHKSVDNPDYSVAQQNVEVAKINYNSATIQASGYHGQGLAAAFSQLAASFAQSAARSSLEEAMQTIANTPRTIEEPIYKKYNFEKAAIQARKVMTVHYYIIDRRKKTYFKSTFDVNEEERFEVAYRISDEDTKRSEHLQAFDTEKDVDEFEKEPSEVKLSQLINHYLGNKGEAKKLRSLVALRKEMLTDKNLALAKYKANTFDARPLNDPRFDSVVVVYTGKGSLGSGFFVKPDIVLTNWHVVKESKYVEMKTYDGQETFGKILGKDVRLDLALIKVQSRGKPVKFYTRNRIDLGATAEAIGHPERYEFSITRGVVSAVRNHFSINLPKGAGDKVLYIQTDAPINHGNSGGPLFLGDEVIGVNTFGKKKSLAEGLNFSVHYSEVLAFLKEHLPGFVVLK